MDCIRPVEEPGVTDAPLLAAARRAAARAHCPYSCFAVGAAVRCRDGSLVCGSNVENANYKDHTLRRAGRAGSGGCRGLEPVGASGVLRTCSRGTQAWQPHALRRVPPGDRGAVAC